MANYLELTQGTMNAISRRRKSKGSNTIPPHSDPVIPLSPAGKPGNPGGGRREVKVPQDVTELIFRVRRQGGLVCLDSEDARLQLERGRVTPKQWQIWEKVLIENRYSVLTILREERARSAWEASGRDPAWWQTYQYGQTEVTPCCTCVMHTYAHSHACSGRTPNVTLDGKTVWQRLKQIVRTSKRGKAVRSAVHCQAEEDGHAENSVGPRATGRPGAATGSAEVRPTGRQKAESGSSRVPGKRKQALGQDY
jgi:hypothetical protein